MALGLAASVGVASATDYTTSRIQDNLQWGDGGGNYYGWSLTLTDSAYMKTSSEGMEVALPADTLLALDSLVLTNNNKKDGPHNDTGVKIAIYEWTASGTVGDFVGLSDNVTTNFDRGATNTLTFTDVTLDSSKQYQFLFVNADTTADQILTFEGYQQHQTQYSIRIGQSKTDVCPDSLINQGKGPYTNAELTSIQWEDRYMPFVSFELSSVIVPEPATATLSLLALAALAARRRRKA